MRREYPAARWDVPTRDPGTATAGWRRKFHCPSCGTAAGRQVVRPRVDPRGHAITAYFVEQVELPYFMRSLPALADGTASFGYSERLRRAGGTSRSAIRQHALVLVGVGDLYHTSRHSPRRYREPVGFWSVALAGSLSNNPFVVTCQNRGCRMRLLVDSLPTAKIMATVRDTRRKSAVLL